MAADKQNTEDTVAVHRARNSVEAALHPFLERLTELAALEPDWDSYGGLPPTARAVEAARRLLKDVMDRTGKAPTAVLPFPSGGLQAIWERCDNELQVDIGPDGAFGYLSVQRGAGPVKMSEAEDVSLDTVLTLVEQIGP